MRDLGTEPAALDAAWTAWKAVAALDGDTVARTWFICGNPCLSEKSPITAVREGYLDELAAVSSWVET